MSPMKTALFAGLGLAPLAFGAAHASDPDEYTLQPIGVGSSSSSSTIIYTPETYTTGTTIQTQPMNTGNGQPETVDINDYLVPSTNSN